MFPPVPCRQPHKGALLHLLSRKKVEECLRPFSYPEEMGFLFSYEKIEERNRLNGPLHVINRVA